MSSPKNCDVLMIGAGMAGASAAYWLQRAGADTVLLEREDAPGYHTTGRSAAVFSETYGNATIRALTVGSRAFYESPPDGFADHPLLTKFGMLMIGREDQVEQVATAAAAFRALVDSVEIVDGAEARRLVPFLREGYVMMAVYEPDAARIDVNALHQGFLRGFAAAGGTTATNAAVETLNREDGVWTAQTKAGTYAAPIVVNAAGAWADEVAAAGGVRPAGLTPKRRTIAVFDPPADVSVDGLPGVVAIDESFYFLAEAGRLMASPADETPSPPCDAQPEEIDIATAVDRFERATTITVSHLVRSWAGLRTFAADKTPVVGFDPNTQGFFWLAGQGGYGIQTAPALSQMAADLILGKSPTDNAVADAMSPARLHKDG
jgi:D-arginine dehydrogenase